jgi:hypothetical protein
VSWRKADAENVGFAIPSSAIAGMDAAHSPVAWSGGAGRTARVSETKPVVRDPVSPPGVPHDSFEQFQRFLSGLAGQRVTLTVEDGKDHRQFQVEVPRDGVK